MIALTKDYERRGSVPPLPLWSNFLRIVPDEGLRRADAAGVARISRRAVAAILAGCERGGLATVEAGVERGSAVVKLTELGQRARESGKNALHATESDWLSKYSMAQRLRGDLVTLVQQFDIELPHFPIGYGPVDYSMTGGHARPAKEGPPRIPAHGHDWVAVVRAEGSSAQTLPLTALLSQALVAFAIDYEEAGHALSTTVIWQQIPDEGTVAAKLLDGCPNPSGWARYGVATIEPSPLKRTSNVALTARGKAVRDDYVPRTRAIETTWGGRFGDELIS